MPKVKQRERVCGGHNSHIAQNSSWCRGMEAMEGAGARFNMGSATKFK